MTLILEPSNSQIKRVSKVRKILCIFHFFECLTLINYLLKSFSELLVRDGYFLYVCFHSKTPIAYFSMVTFCSCLMWYSVILLNSQCVRCDNHIVIIDLESLRGNHKECWDVKSLPLLFHPSCEVCKELLSSNVGFSDQICCHSLLNWKGRALG